MDKEPRLTPTQGPVFVQEEYRTFRTSDGVDLSYTCWSERPRAPARRIVAILPGIGFHSRPYRVVATSLDLPNSLYAALDFRGHGLSGGPRGEMGEPGRMEQDIVEWLADLRSLAPGAPLVLLGESMGSAYALCYAIHHSRDLSGLVLIGPALAPSPEQVLSMETVRNLAEFVRRPSRKERVIDIAGRRLEVGSRDPSFIEMRRMDPLALNAVSPDYMGKVAQAILRVNLRVSLTFACPVYIAHGAEDHIINALEAHILFMRIKAPSKELQVVPKAYHTLFWDPANTQLFARLRRWALNNTRTMRRPDEAAA
jgi:alpha-beta hydrolase superfamily lysophospholipase